MKLVRCILTIAPFLKCWTSDSSKSSFAALFRERGGIVGRITDTGQQRGENAGPMIEADRLLAAPLHVIDQPPGEVPLVASRAALSEMVS